MRRPTPKKSSSARDVDAYIRAAPREARAKLVLFRRIVKAVAPKAEERISYQIPYYDFHGRLVYFAAFKDHISLFVPTPVIEEHKRELKGYETTKATIHFSLHKALPVALIRKLVKARIKKNESAGKKK